MTIFFQTSIYPNQKNSCLWNFRCSFFSQYYWELQEQYKECSCPSPKDSIQVLPTGLITSFIERECNPDRPLHLAVTCPQPTSIYNSSSVLFYTHILNIIKIIGQYFNDPSHFGFVRCFLMASWRLWIWGKTITEVLLHFCPCIHQGAADVTLSHHWSCFFPSLEHGDVCQLSPVSSCSVSLEN